MEPKLPPGSNEKLLDPMKSYGSYDKLVDRMKSLWITNKAKRFNEMHGFNDQLMDPMKSMDTTRS